MRHLWACLLIFLVSCSNNEDFYTKTDLQARSDSLVLAPRKVKDIFGDYQKDDKEIKEGSRSKISDFVNVAETYNKYSKLLNSTDTCKRKEDINLRNKWKSEMITSQKKMFPIIRKEYAQFIRDIYWRQDIEVEQNGTILTFIGGHFASNANKLEMMNTIREQITLLRFKRIEFKWIRHDDDYTYWKISSPNDGALNSDY